MDLKPIETVYNGYRFRSRLEARWAVYFDTLGIEYEYEKEGFDLGERGWYLPDFWLPQVSMWAEVKGKAFTSEEYMKASVLGNVLLLDGLPDYRTYYVAKNGAFQDDYLICNCHGYLEKEGRFYNNTEFYGLFPDEMKHLVKSQYGQFMTAGIVAAKSARFEHGEKPNIKPQVVIKNNPVGEIDITNIVIREGYQITHSAVDIIQKSTNPGKLLAYTLNNLDDCVFVIEPEHIDLKGFERGLNGA